MYIHCHLCRKRIVVFITCLVGRIHKTTFSTTILFKWELCYQYPVDESTTISSLTQALHCHLYIQYVGSAQYLVFITLKLPESSSSAFSMTISTSECMHYCERAQRRGNAMCALGTSVYTRIAKLLLHVFRIT